MMAEATGLTKPMYMAKMIELRLAGEECDETLTHIGSENPEWKQECDEMLKHVKVKEETGRRSPGRARMNTQGAYNGTKNDNAGASGREDDGMGFEAAPDAGLEEKVDKLTMKVANMEGLN